ncbi:MAG: alkylation repair protein [Bacteroidetes bacterium]|nr:alkylation repair protein [Bacteroidota bacterium]
MEIITSKATVKNLLDPIIQNYTPQKNDEFVKQLQAGILKKKIKFPLLEYAAAELYKTIPINEQLTVTDKIIELHELGGNVLSGIMLQLRLNGHFQSSVEHAIKYIIDGDEWFVCDIIGERVLGFALLTQPEKTIAVLHKMSTHENKWIVRCIGVAAHYAIKKGLKKQYVQQVFTLLLSLSNSTEFHTKKGIGWAAKTTAKFYPDLIAAHQQQLETDPQVKQWFKTKIKIGLGRTSKYAGKYTG